MLGILATSGSRSQTTVTTLSARRGCGNKLRVWSPHGTQIAYSSASVGELWRGFIKTIGSGCWSVLIDQPVDQHRCRGLVLVYGAAN
jgi:hypothetical protein